MHSKQEISVMDQLNSLEKTNDRIEDGCMFAERILTNGNALEILLMKKVITAQLTRLCTVPSVVSVGKIEFLTDEKKFEEQIRSSIGRLTKVELGNQSSFQVCLCLHDFKCYYCRRNCKRIISYFSSTLCYIWSDLILLL
jgi:hypothetical protein